MGTVMVENLFEELCSLISSGAEELVHYVHFVAKTTAQYLPSKVSEGLSNLRNLFTLLKASLSSAKDHIKEKCLSGIQFIKKWALLLFEWFIDQLFALITGFKNLSKNVGESIVKSFKTLEKKTKDLAQDTVLPAMRKMVQKRGTVDPSVTSCVTHLTELCENQETSTEVPSMFLGVTKLSEKQENTSVDEAAQALKQFFSQLCGLLGQCLDGVSEAIAEDNKAEAKNK